jgi:outer membrane immunogenic protein
MVLRKRRHPHHYGYRTDHPMTLRKLALALALSAAASSPAFAATTDWTGFYVGATAGHADGSSDVTTTTVYSPSGYFSSTSVPPIAVAGEGQVDPSGFAGSLNAGYNWQSGPVVFGLEGDWSGLNADDSRNDGAVYPCCAPTAFNVYEATSADHLMTLRGRLGYATDRSLFYVTAGWAQVEIEINDEFTDDYDDARESYSASDTTDDWIYGVGYELQFDNNWSFKAEYLHASFDTVGGTSNNLTTGVDDTWPTSVFTHSSDLDLSVIRVGVNYRF